MQSINEAKLNEAGVRFERIMDSAPIAYMITLNGKIVEINETMKKSMGLSVGDAARIIQVVPEHYDRIMEQVLQGITVNNEIMRLKCANGAIRRYLINVTPVKYEQQQAVAVWAVDVEERERKNDKLIDQLQISRKNIQTILDMLPIAVRISEKKTARILYANNACLKMYGFDKTEDLYKRPIYDFVPLIQSGGIDSREKIDALLKSDESMTMDVEYLTASGNTIDTRIAVCNIDYIGIKAKLAIITDLAREKESQRINRNLQTILDMLPVPVRITDSEAAVIIYANKACLKMFGCDSIEQMCNQSIMKFAPGTQSDGSDSRVKVEQLLRSYEPMSLDIEYMTAQGNIIDTRSTVCSIDFNGRRSTLGIVTDLAKDRESQRIRQNLQTVLDMLPVAIRILDIETQKISYANKAAADMFEVVDSEIALGERSISFVAKQQHDGFDAIDLINSMKPTSSEPVSTEILLCKPNGNQFDARVTACLIDYNGKKSSLGIIQNLTAEKEYQRMLQNIAEKEKSANQLKSRFLVNMSHEIRTPMNAIIGLTEIELHSNFPGNPDEIYRKINISAKNLLTLINDVLDLSKIEADKVDLHEEEFELEDVLNSALLVTTPRLNGKNVEIILNGALDIPRYVVGDKTRLWQILKNLLDNSAKFTDRGKIMLEVSVDKSHSDDNTVAITFVVEDTGIGIDEQQIEKIFLPYQQVYNEAQKKYTGTGLGMPISKQLCGLMGGSLSIESKLGEGTRITVNIPFKRSDNNKAELKSVVSPSLSGVKILIVDDDALTLSVMEGLLKNSNADCTTAKSGTEAIDIILDRGDRGESFDVILLDYMMDGLNGLETASRIQQALLKAPEVLMVTAYQRLLIKDEIEKSGIGGVIEKPFTPSQFIGKICSLLGLESCGGEETSKVYMKFANVNVLLCEDLHMNQDIAVGMLRQFGITTDIAENGKDGIELLNSGKTFDLIFMDLQMPIMNGYEATSAIRANHKFDDIPIIGLTADVMSEIIRECLKMGMNDHLAKPIDYDGLYKMLLKWLPGCKRVEGAKVRKPQPHPLNEALARFGNDEKRYNDALLEFSRMLPDKWPDFGSATKEIDKTKSFIHKLKGTSGTLSEKEIYKYATEFELSIHDGNPDEKMYSLLINTCNIVKKRIIKQSKTFTAATFSGTEAELKELLAALKAGLDDYNPDVIDPVIDTMKSKVWATDSQKLDQLYAFIKNFEYTAALSVLDEINSGLNFENHDMRKRQ